MHVRGWQQAYAQLLPADRLDALDPADGLRVARWAARLGADDSGAWVAEADGEIVGWATTGDGSRAAHAGDAAPRPLELEGIYILDSWYGTGVGQALLDAAIGNRPAFLWVAADNPRAQAFYRRNGFALDGAEDEYPMLDTPVRIARMVR